MGADTSVVIIRCKLLGNSIWLVLYVQAVENFEDEGWVRFIISGRPSKELYANDIATAKKMAANIERKEYVSEGIYEYDHDNCDLILDDKNRFCRFSHDALFSFRESFRNDRQVIANIIKCKDSITICYISGERILDEEIQENTLLNDIIDELCIQLNINRNDNFFMKKFPTLIYNTTKVTREMVWNGYTIKKLINLFDNL